MENFLNDYYSNIIQCVEKIDKKKINSIIKLLIQLRKKGGRLIFIGVGGSGANCSHAVNDFRKLCNIQACNPIENVSEFSARINDNGWDSFFVDWMNTSKINKNDMLFILSVGGGNKKRNISMNIVKAIEFAKKNKIKILGIVGREDGETFKKGDCVISVQNNNKKLLTPISESLQSIILHSIVFNTKLIQNKSKW